MEGGAEAAAWVLGRGIGGATFLVEIVAGTSCRRPFFSVSGEKGGRGWGISGDGRRVTGAGGAGGGAGWAAL